MLGPTPNHSARSDGQKENTMKLQIKRRCGHAETVKEVALARSEACLALADRLDAAQL